MEYLTTSFPPGLPSSVQTMIKNLARETVQLHRALTYLRVELKQIALDRRAEDQCDHADQARAALESILGVVP